MIYLGATTQEWLRSVSGASAAGRGPSPGSRILWIVILMVLFSWPTSGNISWPFMAITVLLLVVYYFGWARSRFQGPKVMGAEGELTEIEREFQQAAKGLGSP